MNVFSAIDLPVFGDESHSAVFCATEIGISGQHALLLTGRYSGLS
ncbi:hypothetical protein [Paenibacillus sp. S150]|nr:hypothetical protein [Paenibacillus sp. S150]